jgi:DNA-binding transcriptional ArsR family regulator
VPLTLSNATFRALADQTRRDIVKLLRSGPRTSGEIAAEFDSSWPTISRHLAILREGGLVVAERNGQEIRYEVNASVFQDLVEHLMDWVSPAAGNKQEMRRTRRRAHRHREA